MDSSKKFVNPSPEIKANFLSKLFFCWILPFFKYGYNKDMEVKDTYNAVNDDMSGPLGDLLVKSWEDEQKSAKRSHRPPKLKRAIFNAFWKSYAVYGLYLFIEAIILKSLQPIVLAHYINYFEEIREYYDIGPWQFSHRAAGWILAGLVVFLALSYVVIIHYAYLSCKRIGIRIRVACCSIVYRKMLKLSHASLGKTAAGQVVNLLSNDVERFEAAAKFLHYIWIMPLSFVASFYIMVDSVGLAALAAIVVIVIQSIPFQGYLSQLQGKLRLKIAQGTDYRVKLMSEIVSGIQVIKMYAWEKPFEKLVELSRRHEVNSITKTSYIKGFTSALAVFTERFVLYLVVVVNLFLGKRPTSDVVFSMAQLINSIQLYMCIFFPIALASYSEAKVTMKRLENFLLLEENSVLSSDNSGEDVKEPGLINLEHASASWSPEPIVDTLIDLNLKIPPGTLCCVVGNVGSGKSSLLQLLLKELPLKKGTMDIGGHVSYASQEPWLFVSNVRNNIIFGQQFLKDRYDDIIEVCALEKDFKHFPYGDKTMVGERGVSLSGGQKARINLARTIYTEADIYLFDDPLSAVDTHVGKHLFEKCIKNYLNKKTRILVTHQLQFLKEADMIIVMNNGRIENVGTFSDLPDNVLKNFQRQGSKNDNEKIEQEKFNKEILKSMISIATSEIEAEKEPDENQELIEKGDLSSALYMKYFRSGSSMFLLIFLAALSILSQVLCNGCDLWVTHWTNMEKKRFPKLQNTQIVPALSEDDSNRTTFSDRNRSNAYDDEAILPEPESYLIIYTILILGSILLTSARAILFYKVCMNSSKGLHNKMFANVLKAPMRFFDTNPSGRILNRFSKDIGAVDEILPNAMYDVIQVFHVMTGILVMNFIVTFWMIIPTAILGALFYYLRVIYLSTAQNVKRLEAITRAPVFSHISATLYGMPTIRSSNAQDMIVQEFDILQDQHTSNSFLFQACSEAFGFYLDCISTAFLALVTFQFLVGSGSNSAEVGLVISSSLILTGMLQVGVRQSAEVASNMTSVERLVQYIKLQTEDDLRKPPTKKPAEWPKNGKITFKDTYLRYSLDEEPVLKNLNISIEAGEKVGIVGRTGAGKSTLIASLFRLAPVDGTIAIDDIDTSDVSLEHLRSNISVIPQEPILFSSTIRYNLDPFNKASDEAIWQALANVELKNSIESLDQEVSEGGSNLSAGQRQLICLARAILRNNKILVMDEATANVDPNTDSLIQMTIRDNFKNCTVLTIAHRLNTIMDSDKVLVMDAGEAVEFAPPHELLQNSEGYFTKMVNQTGSSMAAHLRQEANKAYHITKDTKKL